jgi:MFS family permease
LIGSAWWGMGPVYASEIGLTTHQIAGFMTAALVGGLMLQLPIGRLSDRLDRRSVLFWVTVLLSAPVVLLILGQLLHLWIVMAAAAAAYGLASTLYPLSVAYANDYLEPADVVSASAGFVLFYAAGAVAGPLISSTLMTLTGASGLFIYMLVTVGGLALFIAWRMRVRQWIPVVEKEPYVLQPEAQAPGVVSELDPRAEVDDYYDEGPDTLETHHTPEVPLSGSGSENEESTQGTGQQPMQTVTAPGSQKRRPAESEPDRLQIDKVKTDR